jgi:hypothetical protein
VIVAALTILVAISVPVWANASNGSKEADLGSSLLSGVVIGFVLLIVGRMLDLASRRNRDVADDSAALGASANVEPTRDLTVLAGTANAKAEARAATAKAGVQITGQATATVTYPPYRVVYDDYQTDTSRVDAGQIRLRVFRGDEYFQFVTIPIPRPELRRSVGGDSDVTMGRIWWHIAESIRPQLIEAIQTGAIPKADRTIAYEIESVTLDQAVRSALGDTDPEHTVIPGEVVYEIPPITTEDQIIHTQINQILDYGTIMIWARTGQKQYQAVLSRPPEENELILIRELATTYRFRVKIICGTESWPIEPRTE